MKSWKTMLVGIVVAGLYAWANATNMDWKHAAVAGGLAAMGALAKDYNVSSAPQ